MLSLVDLPRSRRAAKHRGPRLPAHLTQQTEAALEVTALDSAHCGQVAERQLSASSLQTVDLDSDDIHDSRVTHSPLMRSAIVQGQAPVARVRNKSSQSQPIPLIGSVLGLHNAAQPGHLSHRPPCPQPQQSVRASFSKATSLSHTATVLSPTKHATRGSPAWPQHSGVPSTQRSFQAVRASHATHPSQLHPGHNQPCPAERQRCQHSLPSQHSSVSNHASEGIRVQATSEAAQVVRLLPSVAATASPVPVCPGPHDWGSVVPVKFGNRSIWATDLAFPQI